MTTTRPHKKTQEEHEAGANEEKRMRREDESDANIKRKIPGRNIDTSAPVSAAENTKRSALVSSRKLHSLKVFHTEHNEASIQAKNGTERKQ